MKHLNFHPDVLFSLLLSGKPDSCVQVREEQVAKRYVLLPVVRLVVQLACTHNTSKTSLMSQVQVEDHLCLVYLPLPDAVHPFFLGASLEASNKTDGGCGPLLLAIH